MENEIWKDIKEYEGLYQVSSLGRVKSLTKYSGGRGNGVYRKSIIMRQRTHSKGYLTVALSKENNRCTIYVHRLIANAFIPNPEDKPQVNHINGIKTDNSVTNLEWNTRSENLRHAYAIGLKSPTITNQKITEQDVKYIRTSNEKVIDLANKYGVSRRTIYDIINFKSWKNITILN